MPKLFLLFSHTLTDTQTADARQSLGVTDFITLPEDLQGCWSNVPPEPEGIHAHLRPVLNWLEQQAQPGDYVLAQGDFGAVYMTVDFALQRELIPIYSTTVRQMNEIGLPDGSVRKQSQFRHVRFREYQLNLR